MSVMKHLSFVREFLNISHSINITWQFKLQGSFFKCGVNPETAINFNNCCHENLNPI